MTRTLDDARLDYGEPLSDIRLEAMVQINFASLQRHPQFAFTPIQAVREWVVKHEKSALDCLTEAMRQTGADDLAEALVALYDRCVFQPIHRDGTKMGPGLDTQGWRERNALTKAKAALARYAALKEPGNG